MSDSTDTNSANNETTNINKTDIDDKNSFINNTNASISNANTTDIKNVSTANASSDDTDIDNADTDTTIIKKKRRRRGKKRKKPTIFARFCIKFTKLRINENINQNKSSDSGAVKENIISENIIINNTDNLNTDKSCTASVDFFESPQIINYITKYIANKHTPQNVYDLREETAPTQGENISRLGKNITAAKDNIPAPKDNPTQKQINPGSKQDVLSSTQNVSTPRDNISGRKPIASTPRQNNTRQEKKDNIPRDNIPSALQINKKNIQYAEKAEKTKSPNHLKSKDELKDFICSKPGPSGHRHISTPIVNSETNIRLWKKYGNSDKSTMKKGDHGSQSKSSTQCSEKVYEDVSSEESDEFTDENLRNQKRKLENIMFPSSKPSGVRIDKRSIHVEKEEKSKFRNRISKDETEHIIPTLRPSGMQKNTTVAVNCSKYENSDQKTISRENSGSQSKKRTKYSKKDYEDVSSDEVDEFNDGNIMYDVSNPQTGNTRLTIDQDIPKTNQQTKSHAQLKKEIFLKKLQERKIVKCSGAFKIDNSFKNVQQIPSTPDSQIDDGDSPEKVIELNDDNKFNNSIPIIQRDIVKQPTKNPAQLQKGIFLRKLETKDTVKCQKCLTRVIHTECVFKIDNRSKNLQKIQSTDTGNDGEDSSEKVVELNDDNRFNNSIPTLKTDTVSQFINTFKLTTNIEEKLARKQQQRNIVEIELSQGESRKKANQEVLAGLSSDIQQVVRDNVLRNMNPEQKMRFDEMLLTNRSPAGVPRSFLKNQESFTAIEPQKDFTNTPPISRWDVQTPMHHIQPVEPQGFVPTTSANVGQRQVYSPTEVYKEIREDEDSYPISEDGEGSETPDILEAGQKRQSAFDRLGPMEQPKKPKLTINLNLNKDQAVREVVEIKKDVPVHDDERIVNSSDETVVKYLPSWPWKKQVVAKKTVTLRQSKTVMMMEKEQMEELYDKANCYIMITATGYPPSWSKEDLLDLILDSLKGKSFVPCFIEFNSKECKFLVARCRGALLAIHWMNFTIRQDDVVVTLSISTTTTSLNKVDGFIPRAVIRQRLAMNYDWDGKLDLSEFTLKYDISHFIYFPLNRECNQTELLRMQSDIAWDYLTELNLSRNRITSLEGFNLESDTPKLRTLDLSHNYIDSIKPLLGCRKLPLKRLSLEGNPLCTDYTDPDRYVKVMRTIFPTLRELDGVPIVLKGDMPPVLRNYCPEEAKPVVEKFLEVFFPLLELPPDERKEMYPLYTERAVMTITYRNRMRHDSKYKDARNLLIKSRVLLEGDYDEVYGASSITRLLTKWPSLQHDPSTFTVDVMFHSETSTIVRVTGLLKLTAESLAEDETLLAFSRTVHLHNKTGYNYKIANEMLYWDEPTHECAKTAFQMVSAPKKVLPMDLKFESPPDDHTKQQLVEIFMKITDLGKLPSERCLEAKDWHIQNALEYFIKLLKSDNLQCLMN